MNLIPKVHNSSERSVKRNRFFRGMAWLVATLCFLASSGVQAQEAAKAPLLEKLMLQELNKRRSTANLPPFKVDERISKVARKIVGDICNGRVAMKSSEIRGARAEARKRLLAQSFGSNPGFAENFQPTGTPESTVRTWMSHKNETERILGDFSLVGIGISTFGDGELFYGVIFVKPGTKNTTTPGTPNVVLTFDNKRSDRVNLFRIRARQDDEFLARLEPGRTIRQLSVGSQVVVKDSKNRVLKNFRVTKAETVVLAAASKPNVQPLKPIATLERELLDEINKKRRAAGLGQLKLDPTASNESRKWSQQLATAKANNPTLFNRMLSQPGPAAGDTPGHWGIRARGRSIMNVYGTQSLIRENVNPTGTPESVVNFSWTNSIPHRDAMMHKDVTHVGIGIARDTTAKRDLYYTAMFFRPEIITKAVLTPNEQSDFEKQVANSINREARSRVRDLTQNATVMKVAREFSDRLAKQQNTSLNFDDVQRALIRERYFGSFGAIPTRANSAQDAVKTWMGTSGLKQELAKAKHNDIGVGVSRGKNGRLYWVLIWANN